MDARSGNDATVTPINEWATAQDGDVEAPEIAVATTDEEGEEKKEPNFIYNQLRRRTALGSSNAILKIPSL